MTKKKKEQLGKGLRALLGNIEKGDKPVSKARKEKVVESLSKSIAEVDIKKISPNPFQPRIEFDKTELLELAQSIKTLGIIQPITLRYLGKEEYQIISGERRWRASKLAGLKKVPAYIRIADDQGLLEMALVENIQRSNLNALEVAISYQRLIDECDLQHDELAQRVGKERSTVTNYIRLLKLPPDIQSALKSQDISMGHAKALLSVSDKSKQLYFFKKILKEKLSVRNAEKLVKQAKAGANKSKKKKADKMHPEVKKIRDRLSLHFGSKIDIKRSNAGKGKIMIHFNSDDQFNDIIDSMMD